jgi:HSP20 family protein
MTNEIQTESQSPATTDDFLSAFDQMRQRFFGAFGLPTNGGELAYLWPARTDVTDTGAAYRLVAEIPGIPKDKLDIRVRGTSVEIRGESTAEKEEKAQDYLLRERRSAGFYRTVELPEAVVAAEAKAKVENGLLELELPKLNPTPSPDGVKVAVQ